MDDVTAALQDAMGREPRPPMPELVPGVLARGRRTRRHRRIGAGIGVTGSTAGVVAVAVLVAGSSGAAPTRTTPAYVGSGAVSTSAANAPVVPPAPTGSAQGARGGICVVPTAEAPAPGAPAPGAPAPGAPASGAPAESCAAVTPPAGSETSAAPVSPAASAIDAPDSPRALAEGATPPAAPSTAQPAAMPSYNAHPAGVPATNRGMAELLARLEPAGALSQVSFPAADTVRAVLTRGSGAGPVTVTLRDGAASPMPSCSSVDPCKTDAGNVITVARTAGACLPTGATLAVVHSDGSTVLVTLGSCPGSATPAPAPLTVDQAVALAEDPRWDTSMSPELVAAGAAHYPAAG